MFFKLTPTTGQPLYLQLMQQIRHAAETGAFEDGDQLPGIRTLAEELVVSPNTVARAYSELEHDGLLELRQGSGAFVCVKRRARSLADQVQMARRRLRDLIERLREEGLFDEEIKGLRGGVAVSGRDGEKAMTETPVILTRDLTKWYDRVAAVRGLNPCVERNRITAFLGQNGAGKSTTIKLLLGMVRPSCGDGTVLGKRITDAKENCEMRRRVAYVAENKPLYGYMSVEQTIRFQSSFYSDWRTDVANKLLNEYRLPPRRKVKSLSKGMQTKRALLLALARRHELLILDEPSEGLDPVGIEHLLRTLVAQAAEGVTIFFSSHQIAEVERVADHICILDHGRLLLNASLDWLRQSYRRIDLVFPFTPPEHEFQITGVERIHSKGLQMRVFASKNAEAVVERAHDLNAVSVDVAPVGLRDIFLETVKEN